MFRHVREQWSCKRYAYLPLAGEVAVTCRDTEDEGVELREVVGLDYGVIRLRGGMHLGEDFLREGLSNPGEKHTAQSRESIGAHYSHSLVDGRRTTSLLDTSLLGFGHYNYRR